MKFASTLLFFNIICGVITCFAQVNVSGYFKKNGTYVAPHVRTYPDAYLYNNYNYPGNYNPNKDYINYLPATPYNNSSYQSNNNLNKEYNIYYPSTNVDYNKTGTNSNQPDNFIVRFSTGSIVQIKFDAKLKVSRDIFSNVITVVPSGSAVKIESSVEEGIFYVSFNGLQGYMNEIYFKDNSNQNFKYQQVYEPPKTSTKIVEPFYGISPEFTTNPGDYVSLKFEGKLKKSESVFSDIITLIPALSKIKIIKKINEDIYYVFYESKFGYINQLYFDKNLIIKD